MSLSIKILFGVLIVFSVVDVAKSAFSKQTMKFYSATVEDMSAIYEQLEKTGSNGSYVIFAFQSSKAVKGSHIELQFSIENNNIGFDWVLLGPEKTRDLEKFRSLTSTLGYKCLKKRGAELSI